MTQRDELDILSRWGHLLVRAQQTEARTLWQQLQAWTREAVQQGVFLPFAYVSAAYELREPEQQILALALLAQGDRQLLGLTMEEARLLLAGEGTEDVPSVFGGRLEQYCLEPGESLLPRRRLSRFILDGCWDDPEVSGLELLPPEEQFPAGPEALAAQMCRYRKECPGQAMTFILSGQRGSGRRTLARACASRLGAPLLVADGDRLTGEDGGVFRRVLMGEILLQRCPVLLEHLDPAVELAGADPGEARALEQLLRETAEPGGLSLLSCSGRWPVENDRADWTLFPLELPLPGLEESGTLWARFLAEGDLPAQADPVRLAGKYRLTPGAIRAAVRDAGAEARWQGRDHITDADLDLGCRKQFRHSLGDKARRVETVFAWEDLILPDSSKSLLRSACDQVRWRTRVYETWGFGGKMPYGSGLSMLFSGPPGTGKTMGAQVVAGELGLELYKVELPAVVSKYVGETEQNLSRIFREAGRSQAIIFFDEADVLFGKRTETKDAQDKYSNMEAAYLLQKMEEYPGISILATNLLQNFDEAFKRRLKFVIDFPFPDAGYRRRLWRAVFPRETPLEPDLDLDFLADRFELSGSAIKNIAVNAAFLAAGAGVRVGMAQLLTALRREMYKSGKQLSREDLGEYYMLAEEENHGGL